MSDGRSSIHEVFGKNVDEEKKVSIMRSMERRFDEQQFEDLAGLEREKTQRELQILELANEWTDGIREKYGLSRFDIPAQNIHVLDQASVPGSLTAETQGIAGVFTQMRQRVIVAKTNSEIEFAHTLCHELVHMKFYGALHIPKNMQDVESYKVGVNRISRSGDKRFFNNLNEAITEEFAKRFVRTTQSNEIFRGDAEETRRLLDANPDATELLDTPEVYAVIEKEGELAGIGFSYEQERRILNMLIDALYERNKDRFQDREQVFDVFGRAACTGEADDVKKMKDLIEQTFGRGTLAEIVRFEDHRADLQEEFVKLLCADDAQNKGTIGNVRRYVHEVKEADIARGAEEYRARVKKLQDQQQQYESTDEARMEREEQWAKEYLTDLGIESWEFLRGKKILDLGAGLGKFADIAKTHGIEVISMEKDLNFWKMVEFDVPSRDVPLVQGDAEHLPFADASFDLIISRAAPPTISQSKEEVVKVISEARRVLKEGGEFRFGPGNLLAFIFDDPERPLFTDQERESLTTDEKVARIRGKSIEFLQSIDEGIQEEPPRDPEKNVLFDHAYVLRKKIKGQLGRDIDSGDRGEYNKVIFQ
ncbi:MAG: class I SAM-dependent methyltransferase [Candidatus Sungbacteria bacterium]|nr:class I SAM-dependent methyltransferase [Candidatus Sungbacteria bacterium]